MGRLEAFITHQIHNNCKYLQMFCTLSTYLCLNICIHQLRHERMLALQMSFHGVLSENSHSQVMQFLSPIFWGSITKTSHTLQANSIIEAKQCSPLTGKIQQRFADLQFKASFHHQTSHSFCILRTPSFTINFHQEVEIMFTIWLQFE